MKKYLYLILLFPSFAFADRLGGLKSNADILLSTQASSGGGSSVYPATATASFPLGLTVSTLTISGTPEPSFFDIGLCNGRLTTQSGVALSTYSRLAQGTIYFTPVAGNRISLFDGSKWFLTTFSEVSLSLSVSSTSIYDVFMSSAGALQLSNAWSSDSTRSNPVVLFSGVYVAGSTNTLRYLGTIRAIGTNLTEDSSANRFVWNYYNRRTRMAIRSNSATHTYASGTGQEWNAATNDRANFVIGVIEDEVNFQITARFLNPGSGNMAIQALLNTAGFGQFTQIENDAALVNFGATSVSIAAQEASYPLLGMNYISLLEYAFSGTITFFDCTTSVMFRG